MNWVSLDYLTIYQEEMIIRIIILLALALAPEAGASDNKLSFDIWGASYHIDRATKKENNYNELNFGVGLNYKIARLSNEKIDTFFSGGFFEDSLRNTSKYVGAKIFWKSNNIVHIGISPFLMSRPNYKRGKLFLAATPIIKVPLTSSISLNATYIPKYDPVNLKETIGLFLTIH